MFGTLLDVLTTHPLTLVTCFQQHFFLLEIQVDSVVLVVLVAVIVLVVVVNGWLCMHCTYRYSLITVV